MGIENHTASETRAIAAAYSGNLWRAPLEIDMKKAHKIEFRMRYMGIDIYAAEIIEAESVLPSKEPSEIRDIWEEKDNDTDSIAGTKREDAAIRV